MTVALHQDQIAIKWLWRRLLSCGNPLSSHHPHLERGWHFYGNTKNTITRMIGILVKEFLFLFAWRQSSHLHFHRWNSRQHITERNGFYIYERNEYLYVRFYNSRLKTIALSSWKFHRYDGSSYDHRIEEGCCSSFGGGTYERIDFQWCLFRDDMTITIWTRRIPP